MPIKRIAGLDFLKNSDVMQPGRIRGVADGNPGELSDEDEDLCPVDCVREFKSDEEFFKILENAKETDTLVVVDFFRPSCGSCKYIEQGFAKLCKGAGDDEAPVIFLKHNVSTSVSCVCVLHYGYHLTLLTRTAHMKCFETKNHLFYAK